MEHAYNQYKKEKARKKGPINLSSKPRKRRSIIFLYYRQNLGDHFTTIKKSKLKENPFLNIHSLLGRKS